jgi:hypothetical protein
MSTTLHALVEGKAGLEAIAAHLDGLDDVRRLAEVRALPGAFQEGLYELAAPRPTTLATLVPEGQVVIYAGKNSMPAFQYFAKAFWRPAGATQASGYNRQFWAWATGPGYFTALDDPESREVKFDYMLTPTLKAEGWPAIEPNTGLLSGLVNGGLVDYNRWLSSNTVIGRAFKGGKAIAHYLVTRVADGVA